MIDAIVSVDIMLYLPRLRGCSKQGLVVSLHVCVNRQLLACYALVGALLSSSQFGTVLLLADPNNASVGTTVRVRDPKWLKAAGDPQQLSTNGGQLLYP